MRIYEKHRIYTLKTEADLLEGAYESTPWILRALGISLPAFLVHHDLREQYKDFISKLERRERVWPFHLNRESLAMRKGFLVVEDGRPVRVWITEMS
jgi:hypothetical protein